MTAERYGIYLRVSSKLQADGNGVHGQREAVRRWFAGQGLDHQEAREYVDEAYTGANEKRPAWQQLQEDIRGGQIDVVVVYDLSRASRRLRHLLAWIEDMVERKVRVVFVANQIDVSTAMGRLILQVMGAIAEYQRHDTSERISTGIRARIAAGERWGMGRAPRHKRAKSRLSDAQWGALARRRSKGETYEALARSVGMSEKGIRNGLKRHSDAP